MLVSWFSGPFRTNKEFFSWGRRESWSSGINSSFWKADYIRLRETEPEISLLGRGLCVHSVSLTSPENEGIKSPLWYWTPGYSRDCGGIKAGLASGKLVVFKFEDTNLKESGEEKWHRVGWRWLSQSRAQTPCSLGRGLVEMRVQESEAEYHVGDILNSFSELSWEHEGECRFGREKAFLITLLWLSLLWNIH